MKQLNDQLWIRQEGKVYTIGVSAQLQCDAGDISYAQIAELGELDVDDTLLNIEASKAAIEVPLPFKATVIARNEKAEEIPSLFDDVSPENNWIVQVENVEGMDYEALSELYSTSCNVSES